MALAGDPVHIVGQPVHDFELAGFPGDGGGALGIGRLAIECADEFTIAEDESVCVPDGEIAFGAFGDFVPADGDQRVVAALVFAGAAGVQACGEHAMPDQRFVRADDADIVVHQRKRSRIGKALAGERVDQRVQRFGRGLVRVFAIAEQEILNAPDGEIVGLQRVQRGAQRLEIGMRAVLQPQYERQSFQMSPSLQFIR